MVSSGLASPAEIDDATASSKAIEEDLCDSLTHTATTVQKGLWSACSLKQESRLQSSGLALASLQGSEISGTPYIV